MNRIIFSISVLFLFNCRNASQNNNPDCTNPYVDEKIEFCLPSENWKIEKKDKVITFTNKTNDSIKINKSVIAIMIDDYQSEFNAKTIRDKHLESFVKSKTLNANLISKGIENINGKKFYDFEIISRNGQIYSYFLFYNKGDIGYNISVSINAKNQGGIVKKDYLDFFKSLKIK